MESRNYFCTWNLQNFGRPDARIQKSPDVFLGAEGAKKARNYLNEEHIFQKGGLADQYPEVRGDLYFVLDDGWDVPYDVHPDTQVTAFGSLILNEDRFPSYEGTPAERLRKINQALKERGWKGVGLWVAAQAVGESAETGYLSREESVRYWSQRILWCREAEVEYWKVDWGCRQFEPEWRQLLNTLRDELMPSLHIEHCHPAAAPVNHVEFQEGRQISDGRFKSWGQWPKKWSQILKDAEIFRSYDVLTQFSQVSTVDRLAVLMQENSQAETIINCEDEVYLGAVLGCSLGIMRSSLCQEIPVFCFDPQNNSHKTDEVIRAVNWQKLAPAFPIREGKVVFSDEMIRESYRFHSGETWMEDYIGKEIFQSCPSIVVRNMDLPKVVYLEEEKPVIAAARHPGGGVSAVSLPRRMKAGDQNQRAEYKTPLAEIVLADIGWDQPVGVFGRWGKVILMGKEDFSRARIFAGDLKSADRMDVTDCCHIFNDRIEVEGSLLSEICVNAKGDVSEPGAVFYIRR